MDAAQQTRMKNIRCCVVGGVQRLVHSKVHSDVHSSVHTLVHTLHGSWRFVAVYAVCKGDKSIKRIPHIQRNSVKYAVFGGVREI